MENLESQPVSEQTQLTEHEQAMIAKVDALEGKVDTAIADDIQPQEDSMLAGKYKSVEELEKAYKELEKRLGQPKGDETKETDVPPESATPEQAKEYVEDKGINFSSLNEEYAQTGNLSEATYKSLEAKGINRETVDSYIEGQKAIVNQYVNELKSLTGSEENYNNMIEWATSDLSPDEQNAFNESLKNKNTASFAIQGLYARYKANAEPKFVTGTSTGISSGVYKSKAEMIADMKTAKYRTDPAFRAEVQRKLAKSKI